MHISFDPAILFLETYPKDIFAHVLIDLCTRLVTTVLFVIAENWKQSKCSSMGTDEMNCRISIKWNTMSPGRADLKSNLQDTSLTQTNKAQNSVYDMLGRVGVDWGKTTYFHLYVHQEILRLAGWLKF
jgi:hypothetical protein